MVLPCLLMAVIVSLTAITDPVWSQSGSARTLNGDELVRIGEIHDVQNHFPEALTYYERALEAFHAHKQRKGEAVVRTKIASIFERQGRRQEADVEVRRALTLFSKTADSPVHADALFLAGRVSLWLGDRHEAAGLLERAKERYRRAQDRRALGAATLEAGLLKVSDGPSDDGLRDIEHVRDEARARQDQDQTLAALVALASAHRVLDRPHDARAYYEQSLALLDRRPQAAIEAAVRFQMAELSAGTGQEEQGLGSAKRAVTLYQSLRDLSGEAASWTVLASLHQTLGHGTEAEEALRRARELYSQQMITVHAVKPASPASSRGEFR